MFCVIFIVHPKAGKKNTYLELAKFLKPKLEQIEGFVDNDRSASTSREGFRVVRDYSMRDRREAPQYYTPIETRSNLERQEDEEKS